MEGGAYGAGKAGGAFDPLTLVRQPHTILRVVSWVFSIVVFGSIVNEGYLNTPLEGEEFCIYNRNPNACSYGVTVGVLTFITCLLYLALDVYFPQISSVKDRKKAVLSDIGVSAFWAFLWFVGFCYLANQWQVSKPKDNPLNEGTDAARAAIAFSFFSIFTWMPGSHRSHPKGPLSPGLRAALGRAFCREEPPCRTPRACPGATSVSCGEPLDIHFSWDPRPDTILGASVCKRRPVVQAPAGQLWPLQTSVSSRLGGKPGDPGYSDQRRSPGSGAVRPTGKS
ncbi:synaptogyrin-1 isoform X1 [Myotis myotis]|uniref:Synaptogyrin 1 n=1 Tax=Myotis myotis TaxID=51298 RepID=A0A7J7Z9G4_MYOMY|nr:synaptogyrin-1 isoform X1 [Myotis myotis]KAF6370764.1 synaptogyrin 1 [Myotis myotis]